MGLAVDDEARSFSQAACAGEGLEYLKDMSVSWSAHGGWTAGEILGVSNVEEVYPDPAIVKEISAGL